MAEVIEIARLGLHDQVATRLRTMLIEGRIAPGAKLNERELSEQLRVSRTPLREAIKLLAVEGLVDLLPNRGAVAVKLTEAELAEIRALHYEMLACFARSDLSGYYRLNALIHTSINMAARNPVLSKTYREVNARVQSLRFRTNQNEAKWKLAVREHEQMLQALDARDAAALRNVLVEHLHGKLDTVLALLRAGEIYPDAKLKA